MSVPQRSAGYVRLFRFVGRIAAIALVWILVVGIATVCFFPPGLSIPAANSEDWSFIDNALVFGSSMTIAGTFATALAFAITGKTKRAIEVVLAVTLAVALLAAVVYTGLWFAPSLARSRIGPWELDRLRHTMRYWSASIVRYEMPLGAVVGLLLGTLAGALALLARRRPRVATGLILGLLFAGASEPVQRLAFGLVVFCGQVVRWYIVSPGMTDPFVPASGVTLGSIAGALIAIVAIWRQRARTSSGNIPIS
jgi:hypothetical protein